MVGAMGRCFAVQRERSDAAGRTWALMKNTRGREWTRTAGACDCSEHRGERWTWRQWLRADSGLLVCWSGRHRIVHRHHVLAIDVQGYQQAVDLRKFVTGRRHYERSACGGAFQGHAQLA